MNATKDQVVSYIMACKAIAESVRELGEVPSGTLYAGVMGNMDLPTYEGILRRLVSAGVIEVTGAHLVRWVMPK